MDRCIFRSLQLINTEIAEATEGDRRDLNDEHLPHRKMAEVELADALIRLLDLGGRYGWKFHTVEPLPFNSKCETLPAKHFLITMHVCHLGAFILAERNDGDIMDDLYSMTIGSIFSVAEHEGYNLQETVEEKLAYNKERLDHSAVNRAGMHGKKY